MSDTTIPSLGGDPPSEPAAAQPAPSKSVQRRQTPQRKPATLPDLGGASADDVLPSISAPAPASTLEPQRYRRWQVLETATIPNGGGTSILHCGQVLSEQHWGPVDGLQRMGVRLALLEE